ncbi:MAG: tetratricopeptide repeat protein [Brevinema sp.]
MKFLIFLVLFAVVPQKGYSQIMTNPALEIRELLHDQENQRFLKFFEQGRFSLLNNELSAHEKQLPYPMREELKWLKGHSLLQIENLSNAKTQLTPLTESTNINVRQRAFLDLASIATMQKDSVNAQFYLKKITSDKEKSSIKEIALAKLIGTYLSDNDGSFRKSKEIARLMGEFEKDYPQSAYLQELQYLYAIYQFYHFHPKAAKEYISKLLTNSTNDKIQYLMAEISLSEQDYKEAQKYYLPLTKKPNRFQDEASYKSALIYKLNRDFTNAHTLLSDLIKYYPRSTYIDRAKAELATLDIVLKNYDNALRYYLFESGFTGMRKALALLKIAEVYYLKGDTVSTRRTAHRIQREFPYSSYANEALYWLGRSYMIDRQFEKSIENFDEYLIREPQSPKNEEITIFLGHSYANLREFAKSRTYFQQIIRYSKNEMLVRNALIGLGNSYAEDQPIRSLEYYDEVWSKWPKAQESAQALYFAGATRYNLRQNKGAKDNFTALTNNFTNSALYPDSVLALAKLEFKSENFQNILDLSSVNTKNKETLSEFKELSARSFFRMKDYEAALPLFQEAGSLTKDPARKQELFLAEGSTLRNLGRHGDAVKQYEKYLSRLKKKENTLQELIWNEIISSYLEVNNFTKASSILKDFEENFPESPLLADLYSKLGDSYFTGKKFDLAISHYQKIPNYTKNKEIISDAAFRETWAYVEAKKPEAEAKLRSFLNTHPSHVSVPTVMYQLSELKQDQNLKYTILEKYPDSQEAENIRVALEKKHSPNSSIQDLDALIRNTSDKSLRSRYLLFLAQKLENETKIDEALQLYLDIHKLQDKSTGAEAAFKAGNIYTQKNEHRKALRLYINIISQYDEKYTAKALNQIILTYIALNDDDNAQKFKKTLRDQYPNTPEAKRWS